MAGNICKLLAMAALLSTTHSQAGNVLFEIGTKDNSAANLPCIQVNIRIS